MWKDKKGYWRIGIKVEGKWGNMFLHRYVWTQAKGEIPDGYDIHHIDFDKDNNDLSNLQMLTHEEHSRLHGDSEITNLKRSISSSGENNGFYGKHHSEEVKQMMSKNQECIQHYLGIRISNNSGFKGVEWNKQKQKWRSRIRVLGNRIHLGLYDTPEQAARAYDEAAKKYFGDDCFLNFKQDNLREVHGIS